MEKRSEGFASWSGICETTGARPRWKYNVAPAISTTAAPIAVTRALHLSRRTAGAALCRCQIGLAGRASSRTTRKTRTRSEEHTSELQSRQYLACRLLL